MEETVYFLPVEGADDDDLARRMQDALTARDLLSFVEPRDMVAIKTHFGEEGSNGFVRPVFFRTLGDLVRSRQGLPFLTETATLYRGRRSNAVDHIHQAHAVIQAFQ